LKVSCSGIGVHVELGKEKGVVVGGVAVLVSFDVLEGWAEIEIV
jgi:hypothetical protein